jgi:hypothetical protein
MANQEVFFTHQESEKRPANYVGSAGFHACKALSVSSKTDEAEFVPVVTFVNVESAKVKLMWKKSDSLYSKPLMCPKCGEKGRQKSQMICKTAQWNNATCYYQEDEDHRPLCTLCHSKEAWFCEKCNTSICFQKHPKAGDVKVIGAQIHSEMPFLMAADVGASKAGFLPKVGAPLTVAPREIPFMPQHKKVLDHIATSFAGYQSLGRTNKDGKSDHKSVRPQNIKSITRQIMQKQLSIRNKPFHLGDRVTFRPCKKPKKPRGRGEADPAR